MNMVSEVVVPRRAYTIKALGNSMGHPVGTVCYEFHGHDYGCAREDTQGMGEPYIAMTLNADATGPFFTAACSSLDPEPLGHYFPLGQ